jgi:hypothetical protein
MGQSEVHRHQLRRGLDYRAMGFHLLPASPARAWGCFDELTASLEVPIIGVVTARNCAGRALWI